MGFVCQFVGVALIGDVANDAKPADDSTLVVVKRVVVSFKESFITCLRHGEAAVLGNAAVAREGLIKIFVFAGFNQKGKEFKSQLANDVFAPHAGNAFHLAVPNRIATLPIKCDDAV